MKRFLIIILLVIVSLSIMSAKEKTGLDKLKKIKVIKNVWLESVPDSKGSMLIQKLNVQFEKVRAVLEKCNVNEPVILGLGSRTRENVRVGVFKPVLKGNRYIFSSIPDRKIITVAYNEGDNREDRMSSFQYRAGMTNIAYLFVRNIKKKIKAKIRLKYQKFIK